MKTKIFWIVLFLLCTTQMLAVTAYPERIVFHQPNREVTLNIYLKGDEKVHWAETEDGYALVHGDDGAFMYASLDENGDMTASQFLATDIKERTPEVWSFLQRTPKHLHFSKSQVNEILSLWKTVEQSIKGPKSMNNVIGEKRFLVVLFAFNDQAFTHRKSEFVSLFNQVNYTTNGSTGSVHDYYYDVSHGQFSLQVDVVGPYTGDSNTAHYGNTSNGYQDFADEAVRYASADVDFSNYDNDGDGYIDGMHIIFAGHGEEASGRVDEIWSHKWSIFDSPVYNNTIINVYSCSPECSGSYDNTLTSVGVICHELGHVFGAPDYYDTDYAGSGGQYPGLGKWDIMSSGSWNRGGGSPAQHNPYTKIYIYHWATCDTLTSPQTVTMHSVTDCNTDFHRINTSTEGDFFLIENRQQQKWDSAIPGHGMLVYHIHPDAQGASVSNYTHPQQIYIMARTSSSDTFPTSTPSSYGVLDDSSTPFPGTNHRDSLTDNTVPWFRPWSKIANHTPITYISENTTHHTVCFCFKGSIPSSADFAATGVSNSKIRLDWNNYGSYNVLIAKSDNGIFGVPSYGTVVGDTLTGGGVVVYIGSDNVAFIDSLLAGTNYYFRLFTKLPNNTFIDSVLNAQSQTLTCGASDWSSENFDAIPTSTLPQCWTGEWTVSDAAAHSGSHSLSCISATTDLSVSPVSVYTAPFSFADSVVNAVLSFNVNFVGCQDTNTLTIRYRPSETDDWSIIKTIKPSDVTASWGKIFVDMPGASNYAMLQFEFQQQNGANVFIDDIAIAPGYLIYSYADDGGSINPNGYQIFQLGDTVSFYMRRHPGYKFANIYIDGTRYTNQIDTSNGLKYTLLVQHSSTIYSTFVRNTEISNSAASPALHVYPNPTTDKLVVNCSDVSFEKYVLCDLYGRYVGSWKAVNVPITIDLSNLPRGIYILRAGTSAIKIVLTK